jgi:HlyD family secretion protein
LKALRWIFLALGLLALAVMLFRFLGSPAPQVPFATVHRAALTSTVITNGQVEPVADTEIRATLSGRVAALLAEQGQNLPAGAALLRLDLPGAQAELEEARAAQRAAEAQVSQAKTGGTPLHQRELAGKLAEARLLVRQTTEDVERLRRLVEASAATPSELAAETRQLELAQQQVASLEKQIAALGSASERQQAVATLATARARVEAAERRLAARTISSPAAGVLYEFLPNRGSWLQPGDLVGRVGNLKTVSVIVYVDEPELGRVQTGIPVTVRWDALPEEEWTGRIDRLPSRIQSFGTRQVGEVHCQVQNPKANLLPGANVNAELLTAQINGALLVPRQAIRRRMGEEGVWLLDGDRVRWRPVRTGISNVTEAQILDGLAEGDRVALLVDKDLYEEMIVQPVDATRPLVR